ncbi:MAG: hypothetical protein ACOCXP_04260 [Candidatus Dojkabacteria bacterium]
MLEEKLKEYLDQAQVVKTLNKDLRDIMQQHELHSEIEELSKKLKEKRDKLKNVTEIALVREKVEEAKERRDLLKDILFAEMNEAGQTEVEVDGFKATVVPSMKLGKA